MNLENHYTKLWKRSLAGFRNGDFEFDPNIHAEEDSRYGVTLLARPSREIRERVTGILDEVKAIAPKQYYYPATDLHLTVLSIISCYTGFSLGDIDTKAYRKIVQDTLDSVSPFSIRFRGLTASPSCIIVQGFPQSNELAMLRDILRKRFSQSNLQHSIDKRYRLQTAHITAIRFKESFEDSSQFLEKITTLRETDFGSCKINQLELVGNDWYQRRNKVTTIAKFSL